MPNVKVGIWNVQNYGAGSAALKDKPSQARYGKNDAMRNAFITAFVRKHDLDVLVIQEASRNAQPSLAGLLYMLRGGAVATEAWAASLCGCSLRSTSPVPPTAAAHLDYKADGRSEGYAVLWRTDRATFSLAEAAYDVAAYTGVSAGAAVASPLALEVWGRPGNDLTKLSTWRPTRGYVSPDPFPSLNGTQDDGWSQLLVPTTGKGNPAVLSSSKARLPVYVVLALEQDKDKPCPVLVYHAPSNSQQAAWGAMAGAMSCDLYVTDPLTAALKADPTGDPVYVSKAVMGGDFNHQVSQGDWPGAYKYYTAGFAGTAAGGAHCDAVPAGALADDARKTTVKIVNVQRNGPGQAPTITSVSSPNVSAFLTLMIDLVFFRNGSGISAARINVIDELNAAAAEYVAVLKSYYPYLTTVVADRTALGLKYHKHTGYFWPETTAHDERALFSGNWGGTFENWPKFKGEIRKGKLTTPRWASEFYTIFISDHLPFVVTIPT